MDVTADRGDNGPAARGSFNFPGAIRPSAGTMGPGECAPLFAAARGLLDRGHCSDSGRFCRGAGRSCLTEGAVYLLK